LVAKRAAWDGYQVTTHWPAANVSVHDTFEDKEKGQRAAKLVLMCSG
jgi:hypothetical protein